MENQTFPDRLATTNHRKCSCEYQTEQLWNEIAELQKRIVKLEESLVDKDQLVKKNDSHEKRLAKLQTVDPVEEHSNVDTKECEPASLKATQNENNLKASTSEFGKDNDELGSYEMLDTKRNSNSSNESTIDDKQNEKSFLKEVPRSKQNIPSQEMPKKSNFNSVQAEKADQSLDIGENEQYETGMAEIDQDEIVGYKAAKAKVYEPKCFCNGAAYKRKTNKKPSPLSNLNFFLSNEMERRNKNATERRIKNSSFNTTISSNYNDPDDKIKSSELQMSLRSKESRDDLSDTTEESRTRKTKIKEREISLKAEEISNEKDRKVMHNTGRSNASKGIEENDKANEIEVLTYNILANDEHKNDTQSNETSELLGTRNASNVNDEGVDSDTENKESDKKTVNADEEVRVDVLDENCKNSMIEPGNLKPAESRTSYIHQTDAEEEQEKFETEILGKYDKDFETQQQCDINQSYDSTNGEMEETCQVEYLKPNTTYLNSSTLMQESMNEKEEKDFCNTVTANKETANSKNNMTNINIEDRDYSTPTHTVSLCQDPSETREREKEQLTQFDRPSVYANVSINDHSHQNHPYHQVETSTESDVRNRVEQSLSTETAENVNVEKSKSEDKQQEHNMIKDIADTDTCHVLSETATYNETDSKDRKEDCEGVDVMDANSREVSLEPDDNKSKKVSESNIDLMKTNVKDGEQDLRDTKKDICSSFNIDPQVKGATNAQGTFKEATDEFKAAIAYFDDKNEFNVLRDESVESLERQSKTSISTPFIDDEGEKILYRDKVVDCATDCAGVFLENEKNKSVTRRTCLKQQEEKTKVASIVNSDTVEQGANQWRALADKEQKDARKSLKELRDVHSVICIDISGSIAEGNAWQRTCTFVSDFLNGLAEMSGIQKLKTEHVALVTFGHETKVQIRFTDDYHKVLKHLETLTLGGPSPMLGGLLMAQAAAHSSKYYIVLNEICPPVFTKMILLTDGRPTQTYQNTGPDVLENKEMDESKALILHTMETIRKSNHDLFIVPVGDADMEFLELMATFSDGDICDFTSGRQLSRRQFLTVNITGQVNMLSNNLLGVNDEQFSQEDQEEMRNIIKKAQSHMLNAKENKGWHISRGHIGQKKSRKGESSAVGSQALFQIFKRVKQSFGYDDSPDDSDETEDNSVFLEISEDSDWFHALNVCSKQTVDKHFKSVSPGSRVLGHGKTDDKKPLGENRNKKSAGRKRKNKNLK